MQFARWTESGLITPSACHEIKLAYYMSKKPAVFQGFLRHVRSRVLRSVMSLECELKIWKVAKRREATPMDVVSAMSETLGRDVASLATAHVLRRDNPRYGPNDLEPFLFLQSSYYDACRKTVGLTATALERSLRELSAEELDRTKAFLRWELFEGHRLRRAQCEAAAGVRELSSTVLSYYGAKTRYVMCVTLELIGRDDLARRLRDL